MFTLTPPAAPEPTRDACPQCESREAIAIYATARTTYFRCVGCGRIRTLVHEETTADSRAVA